jgi:predicted nucleotidyltransferase
MLRAIADALNEEPPAFKAALRKFLKAGHSFVQSRSLGLEELLPGSLAFLKNPNNSLAASYVKRIREKSYSMAAFAVERSGAGFHDEKLPDGDVAASAAAIRALLRNGEAERAFSLMPEASAGLLRGAMAAGRLADCRSRLWLAVRQAILREGAEGMRKISEMGEGLENRMLDAAWRSGSFESFVAACVSRRYTAGRIQRHAMHLLINLGHDESRLFQRSGPAYIRVLGANETGRKLLSIMRETASLPVISRASVPKRVPDSFNRFSEASRMMEIECRATEIWEMLTDSPEIRSEARRVPVIK